MGNLSRITCSCRKGRVLHESQLGGIADLTFSGRHLRSRGRILGCGRGPGGGEVSAHEDCCNLPIYAYPDWTGREPSLPWRWLCYGPD